MRSTILDDQQLVKLSTNHLAVQTFPFLKKPPIPAQVGCCQPPKPTIIAFNTIKTTIANLSPEQQQRLLTLAGLTSAKIVYRQGDQTVVQELG